MSARDRVDGFAALGLVLYLDGDDQLWARGRSPFVDAALPAIAQNREEIVMYLASIPSRMILP